ncbi:MAG: DUF1343 domain-containing protein [Bdellovibrionaceae bacterium]|nr:DUF1343 domain-containing protein [Pseudobdellovibrionaceae bacterium]
MSNSFKLGIESLIGQAKYMGDLKTKRVALVAHPASVTKDLEHSIDFLKRQNVNIVCCFGPQHGMRGEKQDNMVESDDYLDPIHKIPVYSLYGEYRRPVKKWMDQFDICLFDLQDVGTRIYTFLTTLLYMMEACAQEKKTLLVLDRPNPAGRPIEGMKLQKGWESFVGASTVPMRHGMTLGEMALWFQDNHRLNLEMSVIQMENYSTGMPWPSGMPWVNPSPNAPNVYMARAFPGTVMIEGTHFSEGRGTTRPLEVVGAPDIDILKVLSRMESLNGDWLKGCKIRPCFFEPTFHKHQKTLCQAIQIHTDGSFYNEEAFKPYRLMTLFFKAVRQLYPTYQIWRDFPYEYERDRLAIDLINGSDFLRNWVDLPSSKVEDFENECRQSETAWNHERKPFLLYS